MRITPSRHELEFGEGLSWAPPALAARFYLWGKTSLFRRTPLGDGGDAPGWRQVAGYDIDNGSRIAIAGETTTFTVTAGGVVASWETVAAAFDSFDPEIAFITAADSQGRPISIDRYSVPNPESSAAATIAAQERAYLQALLTTRIALAGQGHSQESDPSGTAVTRVDVAVLDRRVAETRARIAWFEQAARGNTMPRAEMW